MTFQIPEEFTYRTMQAHLVGEFNEWSKTANPMKRRKNGVFSTSVDLEVGKEYQFGYLIAGTVWKHDPQADRIVPSPFGDSYNSVVVL